MGHGRPAIVTVDKDHNLKDGDTVLFSGMFYTQERRS